MAIRNSKELEVTQQQLARIEAVLDEMHHQETPEMYALLCEPYVDLIIKMRQEINEYLGINRAIEQQVKTGEIAVVV